jgi:hypothetical protein
MWKSVLVTTLAIAGMALASASRAADTTAPDLAALQAAEPTRSVQSLYTRCTAADIHDQMFCAGYFTSSIDNMMVLGVDASTRAFGICPKVSITVGASVQAFKNWAQKHPEAWGLPRYVGVAWALQEVWSCK